MLKELYDRAKKMIAKLEWFSIEHVRRERNKEADALANEAMDRKRPGQVLRRAGEAKPAAAQPAGAAVESSHAPQPRTVAASTREYRGVVRDGRIELIDRLPDGTRVLVKVID
jgi:probable phosphoglycerate mutase